ncbi:hypothetical protein DIPPA_29434 [Diplonema papillatum]|nr:hypothetical protein DIPPA_29434 [Diplonema papillatum]
MPGLSLGELGLSDLAKAIGPTRSAAERVAGFKSLRSVFEADPKALCREGADAALQAARDAVEAGVKPWLGRALQLLCCAVTCDGASLLSWGEPTACSAAIAKCLRAAMHHTQTQTSSEPPPSSFPPRRPPPARASKPRSLRRNGGVSGFDGLPPATQHFLE